MHDLLKILAVVVGLVAAVVRLSGVVAPELARRMIRVMLEKRVIVLVMMVVVAVLGSLFIYAFRAYVFDAQIGKHDFSQANWAAWVLLGLGIAMTAGGLLFLMLPNVPIKLMAKFYVARNSTLRLLCLFGGLVAAGIAAIGWFCLP